MPNQYYADIFAERGASYDSAMRQFPNARDQEFAAVLTCLSLEADQVIVDVPAGGGYLSSYLPSDVIYRGFDFAGDFGHSRKQEGILPCAETEIPLDDQHADAVICLAALHHVQDRIGFFKEASRVLSDQGQFVIGDVAINSKPAVFLNQFVNSWNRQGHQGDFIQPMREVDELKSVGFGVKKQTQEYFWQFISRTEARNYLRLLFCLDKNPSDELLDKAIDDLGYTQQHGNFALSWQLEFLVCNKR